MARGGDKGGERLQVAELEPALRVDYERVKREVGLLDRARSEGRDNRPASNGSERDEGQARLFHRIAQGVAGLQAALAERLSGAVAAAQRRAPRPIDAAAVQSEAEARFSTLLFERRGELVRLRERELEGVRHLNWFRRTHDLQRPAKYRESPWLFGATLLGLLVLESLANAFLLRRVSEQGWLGGVVLAALISAVNIGLGVAAGSVGWRLIGHRFLTPRLVGWAIALLCHTLALFWNLFVAHFREVVEQNAIAAQQAGTFDYAGTAANTLAHIQSQGFFGLQTLLSWGLLFIGLGVHLYSAKEGWDDMADRYWDYKPVEQTWRDAREDYEAALEDARADAEVAVRELTEGLRTRHRDGELGAAAIAGLVDSAEHRSIDARNAESEWIRQGAALLKAYRDENAAVRTDAPPSYFSEYPTAQEWSSFALPSDVALPPVEESRRAGERSLDRLRALAEESRAVNAANAAAMVQAQSALAQATDAFQQRLTTLRASVEGEARASVSSRTVDPQEEGPDGATARA